MDWMDWMYVYYLNKIYILSIGIERVVVLRGSEVVSPNHPPFQNFKMDKGQTLEEMTGLALLSSWSNDRLSLNRWESGIRFSTSIRRNLSDLPYPDLVLSLQARENSQSGRQAAREPVASNAKR